MKFILNGGWRKRKAAGVALRTAATATPEAIQRLAETNLYLVKVLSDIASIPTWRAKATDGNDVTHTYGVAVDKAKEALANIKKKSEGAGGK